MPVKAAERAESEGGTRVTGAQDGMAGAQLEHAFEWSRCLNGFLHPAVKQRIPCWSVRQERQEFRVAPVVICGFVKSAWHPRRGCITKARQGAVDHPVIQGNGEHRLDLRYGVKVEAEPSGRF